MVSPKDYADRAAFNKALIETVDSLQVDLIVLAGYLVVIPPEMIENMKTGLSIFIRRSYRHLRNRLLWSEST